jgi:hypothetical protein
VPTGSRPKLDWDLTSGGGVDAAAGAFNGGLATGAALDGGDDGG